MEKKFSIFQKYISKTVKETINIIGIGINKNISVTFF